MKKILILLLGLSSIATKSISQTNTFPASGNVGVGTTTPKTKFHMLNVTSVGVKTTYGSFLVEGVDTQLDLISSKAGTWGSTINFVEGNGSSNTNVWSISRQTTNGDGDSSLNLNFGTKNQHNNANILTLMPTGNVGIGNSDPNFKLTVQGDWNNLINFGHTADDVGRFYSTYEAGSPYLNFIESDDPFVFNFLQTATGDNVKMGFHRGNVGIGTTRPDSKLSVNGNIRAKEVKVETTNWPDYVFEAQYKLMPLVEVKKFVQTNGHLPDIPSAKEVSEQGVNLGEMDANLLQKIEELTLYIIHQNELITNQADEIEELQQELIMLAEIEDRLLNLERKSGDETNKVQVNNSINDQ